MSNQLQDPTTEEWESRQGEGGAAFVSAAQSESGIYRNEDADTENGKAFSGTGFEGSTASEFAHLQLFNPVGSGVIVLLDSVVLTAGSNAAYFVRSYNTALSSLDGNWLNCKLGSPDGAAEIRTQADASALGDALYGSRSLANTPWRVEFKRPLKLAENQGIVLLSQIVNVSIWGSFMGREI